MTFDIGNPCNSLRQVQQSGGVKLLIGSLELQQKTDKQMKKSL
jgi:hypothetical protein